MSAPVLAVCQPWPASGPVTFQPGTCYTFTPHATSWWTPQHITLTVCAALWAAIILAFLAALAWDTLTSPRITARQWSRVPEAERQRRAAEFKAADAALQGYEGPNESGRYSDEDETYNDLNGRVNDLWPTVPWWCRR